MQLEAQPLGQRAVRHQLMDSQELLCSFFCMAVQSSKLHADRTTDFGKHLAKPSRLVQTRILRSQPLWLYHDGRCTCSDQEGPLLWCYFCCRVLLAF